MADTEEVETRLLKMALVVCEEPVGVMEQDPVEQSACFFSFSQAIKPDQAPSLTDREIPAILSSP
jgi:hypothetical protein